MSDGYTIKVDKPIEIKQYNIGFLEVMRSRFNSLEKVKEAIKYAEECTEYIAKNPQVGFEDMIMLHQCAKYVLIDLYNEYTNKEKDK